MWRTGRTGLPEVLRVNDSSPDTAETSFRELDDVFLQTQTRIWLGEVLHVRFDDDVAIADLLADGEMLFQVSKKVWKMLLKKHGELKHSKVYIYERTSSGRIDGRYMPYPKVDSFLKICQILGLTGIDMFTSSDVVEKRDTRRVCMCIRSLSKKARSKQLNVPDFDIVTYAIAMPTNLVDGIRKYLELSHFCSSRFNGSSPWNDTSETCQQKARCGQHYQYYDSGSDEADSIFNDLDLQCSLSNSSSDVANISCTVRETSQGIACFVEENVPESGFMARFEDNNHPEDVGVHQEVTLIQTAQFFSSSLHSEIPTYHGTRICLADVGGRCGLLNKSNSHSQQFGADNDFLVPELEIPVDNYNFVGGFGSNKKDVGNRLKAELNIDSIEFETSSPASTIASSVEVAPCKKNCHSLDSVLVSFLDHVVPNKVGLKNSIREHVLERKDDSMEKRFDDTGIFVKRKSHGISNGVDGDDDDLQSESESLSTDNLSSLDPSVSDFKPEESYYSMVSSEVEPLFILFADKQNEFVGNPRDPSSKKSQDAMDCAGSLAKNHHVLPSQCDDPRYPSCSESTASLVSSSSTKNRFECCPFSSICPLCNDQKSKYRCSKIWSENFVFEVKMGPKENLINAELSLGQDDEKEERKVYRYSTLSNFRNKLLSRNLNESECGSKTHKVLPNDYSCYQTEIEKDMPVEFNESLCKETRFSMPCSIGDGTVSKNISGCVEVHSAALVNSGNNQTPCIISTLPCIAFILSNEQKVPDKDHKPENIDRSIYDRVSSVNDFSSVRLNLHQTSPTGSHNTFLIMEHCLEKKVAVNLEMSFLGYGKISSFVNLMAKKLHIYADDLDILACTASIPGSVRDDFVLSSCPLCIEETQITTNKTIKLEKQMFCHIDDDLTSIMSLESVEKTKKVNMACGRKPRLMPCPNVETKGRVSGTTRKPGNQVMKSVAGVVTAAGALAIFFHFRQRSDRDRSERATTPLQSRKPNHGVFTKSRVLDAKSRSLYPGEKFNF